MVYSELVSEISVTSGIDHETIKRVFDAFAIHVGVSLAEGDKVTLKNFGNFYPDYIFKKGSHMTKVGFNPSGNLMNMLEKGEEELVEYVDEIRSRRYDGH